jgi:group I intron endonuclease
MIYMAYNTTADGKTKYYIGKTKRPLWARKASHKCDANKGVIRSHFYSAIRKYGWDSFKWHILMPTVKEDAEMDNCEKFLIALFKSDNREFGYNLTAGGDGGRGRGKELIFTAEHRANISKAKKGCKRPDNIERNKRVFTGRPGFYYPRKKHE